MKKKGKVVNLEAEAASRSPESTLGIAHTRWATHGPPTDVNAHPHMDASRGVAVVHNGIIENFSALKTALQKAGYVFVSETDTEVLAHLVTDVRKKHPALSLESVVRLALASVEGAFGVCFVFADQPDLLIGARHGSPLLLGVGEGEFFLASDASAVIEHTKTVEYLKEREMVSISSCVICGRGTLLPLRSIRSLPALAPILSAATQAPPLTHVPSPTPICVGAATLFHPLTRPRSSAHQSSCASTFRLRPLKRAATSTLC